jgi:exosome complex component CSL4
MTIQTVDGTLCADESDFQGVIRAQDVRQTDKDKVRIWHCFRPGDIVRASVLSLGDARSYYLSTARNDLGVIFASTEGRQLEPVSWEAMRDPETGELEPRKVAGPAPST